MRHINSNGGFTRLYQLARENRTLKDAALELQVPQKYITEYLKEQGIKNWKELVNESGGLRDDYSIIDEKGGVLFIIDQLINGNSIRSIAKDLNVKTKFINDYLNSKGLDSKEINKYISKWHVEVVLKNFGGVDYIKNNLELGLSLTEISEECKIPTTKLSKYLKENS